MSCLRNNPLAIVALKFTARLVCYSTYVPVALFAFASISFIKSVVEDWKDQDKLDGFLDYAKNGVAYTAYDFVPFGVATCVMSIFHYLGYLPGSVLLEKALKAAFDNPVVVGGGGIELPRSPLEIPVSLSGIISAEDLV